MKAAMLYGVRDLRIEDVSTPKLGSGEVLVKVKAATTCGTDLKIFQRGYIEKIIQLPTIFGHEWAGDVKDVGDDVEWPKKGMRVRAGNSAPCLRCHLCQKGNYNLCENMLWLWGAYAEYIAVPARMVQVNLQEIPPQVSYEEAAITEPLACVLHGIEEAKVGKGDQVAIIGAGPIGLLHLLVAKRMGAERVICIDLTTERLGFAKHLGADETVLAGKGDTVQEVRKLTEGYGADVIIEAIGLPTTWIQAVQMVRKGGRVLEFGGCPPGTKIEVPTDILHYGEVTMLGTFHATPSHFKKALNLIAAKTLDVKPLVTRKMKLENIREAFQSLLTSKKDIKIAVIP